MNPIHIDIEVINYQGSANTGVESLGIFFYLLRRYIYFMLATQVSGSLLRNSVLYHLRDERTYRLFVYLAIFSSFS